MNITVRKITFAALMMALNVAFSCYPLPLGVTNLYLTDIAVCVAGIILPPLLAFVAGGVGAFLGDVFFYPKAMFVTLAVRTVQVVLISVFSHYIMKKKPALSSFIGCIIGAIIMAGGYSFLGAIIYGNLPTIGAAMEYALVKLPFEALQATVGVTVAIPLCYKFRLRALAESYFIKDGYNK